MDKLTFAPIQITLYDENDEPIKTYSLSVVRWGLLKKAIKLSKQINQKDEEIEEEAMDAISAFVCQLFRDKFTPTQLDEGADIAEIMSAFRAVVNRAAAVGNV